MHLEGTQKLIFNGFAAFTAIVLGLVTSVVFVRQEILGRNKEISREVKEVNDIEDTVYVSAPDDIGGAMA